MLFDWMNFDLSAVVNSEIESTKHFHFGKVHKLSVSMGLYEYANCIRLIQESRLRWLIGYPLYYG